MPWNNASPGWITSTSGRFAVAVVVAAAIAIADVVAIAVAAALAAQRNIFGPRVGSAIGRSKNRKTAVVPSRPWQMKTAKGRRGTGGG